MPAPTSAPEWVRRSERGAMPLIRFMAWFSLTVGRTASRILLLRGIAAYFLVSGGPARRATRDFLTRALGRAPTLAELYRSFFGFAATIHDRIYFLRGRFELFEIEAHGQEIFDAAGGALLMGAHLGSFEVMRSSGRNVIHRKVVMAMYGAQAQKITAVLHAISPEATQGIVALGEVGSMLALQQHVEEGALVGVLADRTFGGEPTTPIPFMGATAPFPTGPMRMAAALRQKVVFMAGLYEGGNRYSLHFEPLADFSNLEGLTRAERDRKVHDAIVQYAQRLEHHARSAPHNWFNFFDFWTPVNAPPAKAP